MFFVIICVCYRSSADDRYQSTQDFETECFTVRHDKMVLKFSAVLPLLSEKQIDKLLYKCFVAQRYENPFCNNINTFGGDGSTQDDEVERFILDNTKQNSKAILSSSSMSRGVNSLTVSTQLFFADRGVSHRSRCHEG